MEFSSAPHKLLPFAIAVALFSSWMPASSDTNQSSYDEPGPRSSCYIKIDNPHISTFYLDRKQRRVKVNARSVCSQGHVNVKLTIEIWKRGFFGSELVKKFSTNPSAKSSSGEKVELKSASVGCRNQKNTKYFAYGYASAKINGKPTKTSYATTAFITLNCGT